MPPPIPFRVTLGKTAFEGEGPFADPSIVGFLIRMEDGRMDLLGMREAEEDGVVRMVRDARGRGELELDFEEDGAVLRRLIDLGGGRDRPFFTFRPLGAGWWRLVHHGSPQPLPRFEPCLRLWLGDMLH